MTCIVGYIDRVKKEVLIGGDSAGVSGLDITIRKDTKVFKVGDFVIGCTSSFRMIQLLRFSLLLPRIHDKDIYEYMCTDFVNAVKDCFSTGGFLQKYPEGDNKGGIFLVGYKDRLFYVGEDFQVGESVVNYAAAGCGKFYALGSLAVLEDMLSTKLDANHIITKALETATKFSGGVCEPYTILSTTNTESK